MRIIPLSSALALSVVVLIVLLVTGIHEESRRTADYRNSLRDAAETRGTTWEILSALQQLEIGHLGYVLSGDSTFLDRHEAAIRSAPELLEHLEELTERRAQNAQAELLAQLVRDQLSFSSAAISARGDGENALDTAVQLQDRSAEITAIAENLLAAESIRLQEHALQEQERSASFERSMQVLLALIALLVVTATAAASAYVRQRRRSERELSIAREAAEASRQQAEQASRAKTDFLASMSHEIRTPLNGIIGYSELLFDTELSRDQRRYLERVQFAGSALLSTVNDILDFSKIEAGRVQLRPHAFSLGPLINNATSIVADQAHRKGLSLDVELAPDLPNAIMGDEGRIRQVLLNLLNNAFKFTEKGSIRLSVEKVDRVSGPCIRFTVTDTGIGIAEAQLERLFVQFYQVDQARMSRFGGTGLGLAISKRLAEAMGGEIGVRSEEAKGSSFWFTIPYQQPSQREVAVLSARAARPSDDARGRILLVEDLEHNRDLAKAMLTNFGHTVDIAENGIEALEKVQTTPYDVVLMDIQMPLMDGLTATRKIRELNHPARDVPIIAMTANVLPHQVKMFGEAGMNGHAAKPFKKGELLEKVAVCLQRARLSHPSAAERPDADEIRDLLGQDWVGRATRELRQRIDEAFATPPMEKADRLELARRAHAMISISSMLGYTGFAELCARLEQRTRTDADISAVYDEAKAAARDLVRETETALDPAVFAETLSEAAAEPASATQRSGDVEASEQLTGSG